MLARCKDSDFTVQQTTHLDDVIKPLLTTYYLLLTTYYLHLLLTTYDLLLTAYYLQGATRLDLDDVNGEVVLVRWEKATEP